MSDHETPRLNRSNRDRDAAHWSGFKFGFWVGAVCGLLAGVVVAVLVIAIIGPALEIAWRFFL